MGERGYASVLLAAVVALCLAAAAFGAHEIGVAARRAQALDLDTAQARLAADTGLERISRYLAADPDWSDGSVAVGPVGDRAAVESVTIEREGDVVVVTSVGVSGGPHPVRKTVRARLRLGLSPLVASYGGGVKVLGGSPLRVSGNTRVYSDVMVSGGLELGGNAQVGWRFLWWEWPRKVYVSGDLTGQRDGMIIGSAYATGSISPGDIATGENVPRWTPPVPFPDIARVADLIELGRMQAQLLESSGGGQRYFPGDHTFTFLDLLQMEGPYFVEGTAHVWGGIVPSRATIVAAEDIVMSAPLVALNSGLIAGRDIVVPPANVVLAGMMVAGRDIGWGGTGGFELQYGVLVAATLNQNDVRGNIVLAQKDDVNFSLISGPVHVAEVLERVGD